MIKNHAILRVHCCLKRSDFDVYIKGIIQDPILNDPYFLCFYKILAGLSKSHKFVDADIQTIFDEQGAIGTRALFWWEYLMELYPKEFKKLKRPIFQSDSDILPLQAADLYAWHFHAHIVSSMLNRKKENTLHIDKIIGEIPCLSLIIERDEIIDLGCSLLVAHNSMN